MNATKTLGVLGACLIAALSCGRASAQSTDGYHSIQIFPVVAETGSFTQRFSFRNPNATSVTITPKYFPAKLTTGTAITCPDIVIAPGKTATVVSLRVMCPALALGNQFGFLYTSETSPNNLPYSGFSRAANPQGNGFAVEAFPAHTFTSADSVVNGIRRVAATGSQPTYQTNCFVGNLNDVTPAVSPVVTTVHYTLYDSGTNVIGGGDLFLAPGQVERLSDIFAVGLAPAGDWNDAQIRFEELGPDEPAILAFCTVQENTTFGADFRVAKQELGAGGQANPFTDVIGSQDNHVTRNTLTSTDSVGRNFAIAAGANANTHIVYFRHPDYAQCEIIDPNTNVRALAGYGLEIRMLDQDGLVMAGGNNITGFGEIYLGDKTDRNGGSNTRYRIEVEDSNVNTGAIRPYKLHCQSGSGHTLGDLIKYQVPGNLF
ncbi:MAG: hypothetical protein ABIP44_10585 [Pseudoxanthomonas sp.]